MESMFRAHFRFWEMVDPRNLKVSTADTELLRMVMGQCGGVAPKVHCHLHSFERVQLEIVLTTPEGQLFHLLPVCRLVTVLDEADDRCVICKLQEFDRWVS